MIQSFLKMKVLKKYLRYNHHPYMKVSGIFSLLKYYNRWLTFKKPQRTALEAQLPWINFEAIDFLKDILTPNMKVFEYGTGGSSIFFAKNVLQVIGIEHDDLWFQRVKDCVEKEKINNFTGLLLPPVKVAGTNSAADYADPKSYFSSDEKYLNRYSFFDYASSIDSYEDSYFDIVSIDGRARPSCIKHAVAKIKVGGYLLLDNSDREYYTRQMSIELQNFEKVFERFGPGPFNDVFWGTTFYKKIR